MISELRTKIKSIKAAIRSGLATGNRSKERNFQLFDYMKPNGEVDYERYRMNQVAGNKAKIEWIWVKEENIKYLADYISGRIDKPKFGICHGTRRGNEQLWFRKYLNCDVIGTEISDSANQFPFTIQWDFHQIKPEWVGSMDFIYSNSLDHSYAPDKCLEGWMTCLKKNGVCIVEHSSGHEDSTELDPFGAPVSIMPYLILTWSKNKFCVREVLDAPFVDKGLTYLKYLIIENN
jgi:hypothetical protein